MTATMPRPVVVPPRSAAPTRTRSSGLPGLVLFLLLGFGGGFLIGHLGQEPPHGVAGADTAALVQDNIRAFNEADAVGVMETYAEDAVFTVMDREGRFLEYDSPGEIWTEMGGSRDLRTTSELVEQGGLVSATYVEAYSAGVVTFEIVGGRIAHEWIVIGELTAPPQPNGVVRGPVSWANTVGLLAGGSSPGAD